MISQWQVKHPLTIEERRKIKEGLDLELSYSQLATYVNRAKTTVMREAKRLGKYTDYDPEKAQQDFENKQRSKFRKNIG